MAKLVPIRMDIDSDVRDALDIFCTSASMSRTQLIEEAIFLHPEFGEFARQRGITRTSRRPPGNPNFGPGYRVRWDQRDERESEFHELDNVHDQEELQDS